VVGYVIQINVLQSQDKLSSVDSNYPEIQQVIDQYADVFPDQMGLPPHRNCDHHITLMNDTKAPNVIPYRVPHKQRDEVHNLIKSMLQDGIIKPSTSPYSSPAILVRKKDGSWRHCIDYRELNAQTVKDKFPIPVIEDLLDELYGPKLFSKLVLRSGYH
jgi:hypothetical protein